jgi:hypothetical protein
MRSMFGNRKPAIASAPTAPVQATPVAAPASEPVPAPVPAPISVAVTPVGPSAPARVKFAPKPTTVPVVRNGSFLADVEKADGDIYKGCNGIKRMGSVAAAAIFMDAEPEQVARVVERVSDTTIQAFGFNLDDREKLGAVSAMVMEPVAAIVAQAARNDLSIEDLQDVSVKLSRAVIATAQLRPVQRAVEQRWPADLDSSTMMKLSACLALTPIAVEAEECDFFCGPAVCLKEAARLVVEHALEIADRFAPENASDAARLVLSQSIIQSAGRLYAACYRREAQRVRASIAALPKDRRAAEAARIKELARADMRADRGLESNGPNGPIARIATRFLASLESIVEISLKANETRAAVIKPRAAVPRARNA